MKATTFGSGPTTLTLEPSANPDSLRFGLGTTKYGSARTVFKVEIPAAALRLIAESFRAGGNPMGSVINLLDSARRKCVSLVPAKGHVSVQFIEVRSPVDGPLDSIIGTIMGDVELESRDISLLVETVRDFLAEVNPE